MKNLTIANNINKISIAVLLFGSLVYHITEALTDKRPETIVLKPATVANPLPSSSLSFVLLVNKNFIKP